LAVKYGVGQGGDQARVQQRRCIRLSDSFLDELQASPNDDETQEVPDAGFSSRPRTREEENGNPAQSAETQEFTANGCAEFGAGSCAGNKSGTVFTTDSHQFVPDLMPDSLNGNGSGTV